MGDGSVLHVAAESTCNDTFMVLLGLMEARSQVKYISFVELLSWSWANTERVDDVVVIVRQVGCGCVRCELLDIVCMLCGWMPVGFCVLLLKIFFELVFERPAHFRKVVFSHVAIGAVSAWLRGWAILAGGFVSQSVDLFFNFGGSRMHDGYVGCSGHRFSN